MCVEKLDIIREQLETNLLNRGYTEIRPGYWEHQDSKEYPSVSIRVEKK